MLKQHEFSLRIERTFTREAVGAADLIHFREVEAYGDETLPAFEAPHNWSAEAAGFLAEDAACRSIPAVSRLIEENTVPSWLWRRMGEGVTRTSETSAQQIFHRIAGKTTYTGWKKDIFVDESEARIFFDEIFYMMAQRFIAIEPLRLSNTGTDWAYGFDADNDDEPSHVIAENFETADFGRSDKAAIAEIRNESIDALLAGDAKTRRKWQAFIEGGAKAGFLSLRFTDIATDWNANTRSPVRAGIDLLCFRRKDGSVDIERLRHAVKILVVLLALQDDRTERPIAIGLHNLAPLLMSQALAYDSEAGRMTAAAVAAIVSAEATAISAQLAALLGPADDFGANREAIMRSIRNHRRAAYGDRTDYEKISVLPVPLSVDTGADLALVAAARRRWDEAQELAQEHGLHFTRLTDFSAATGLAFFMESVAQGIAPMPALAVPRATEFGVYRRELHPAVNTALAKLGYDEEARHSIITHIAGHKTLSGAHGVGHAALRRHGFDTDALDAVDEYLPNIADIRFAFTPWILGEDFYRRTLKIPPAKMADPRFDLLRHLGFTDREVSAANAYVYGHGTAVGAKGLRPSHTGIFVHAREAGAEARIRMAASVQGMISGDTGLQVQLFANCVNEAIEKLLLNVWRQGVKSIAIAFTAAPERKASQVQPTEKKAARKIQHAPAQQQTSARPGMRNRPKASSRMLADNKSGGGKKRGTPRSHGRGNN